ncbi:MAG TPA: hypothetical protein VMT62_05635 [Syntrophorhabdaceae bacterium]|nr:hypothetical protein [Syntrophorhabdaceae bacterium]
MNLYYMIWIGLLVVGLATSLTVFILAHAAGQFREQERARYLPLRGEADPTNADKRGGAGREIIIAAGILLIGLSGIVAALVTMIVRMKGVTP